MARMKWNIGVVQMDCVVGETQPNIEKIRNFAELASKLGVDIAVFPECATTGYFLGSKLDELSEPPDGPTSQTLAEIAKANGLYMAVGAFTRRDNGIYNSQLLFAPDGRHLATYDKAHLFAGERELCQAGDRPCVVDTPIGKIGMTICYDLIFPDYIRHIVDMGADLIINSTNWITDTYQRETWGWSGPITQGLVSTRALENLTFVAMANRVGRENATPELEFTSFGYSCVAAPSGKVLASLPEGEGVAVARIDVSEEDFKRWTGIATYKEDRRPELVR